MKRILSILLVLLLIISFVACDLELEEPEEKDNPSGQTGEAGDSGSQSGSGSQGGESGDQGGSGTGTGEHGDAGGQSGEGGQTDPVHDHTYEDAWTHDWTYHWHAATCGHDTTYAKGNHTYVDGVCTVCGFTEPKVGDTGPAGGIIFYDKGSYSNGWRFLEAAPSDLRVIDGVPTVDPNVKPGVESVTKSRFPFGFYVNSETGEIDVVGTAFSDLGQGRRNTQILVATMGDVTYGDYDKVVPDYNYTTGYYAARVCDILVYNGFDDWYLPSYNELNRMYTALHQNGLGGFYDSDEDYAWYWTSTENGNYYAQKRNFKTGSNPPSTYKNEECRVRPVRYF